VSNVNSTSDPEEAASLSSKALEPPVPTPFTPAGVHAIKAVWPLTDGIANKSPPEK
jgi:hypothetical protein